MGLFGIGKKKEIVDLGERYRRRQEREEKIRQDAVKIKQTPSKYANSISADSLDFFAKKMSSANSQNEEQSEESEDSSNKKKKLAKRLADIYDRIEDLSTQIYHLQQRIEVVEQKMRVGMNR